LHQNAFGRGFNSPQLHHKNRVYFKVYLKYTLEFLHNNEYNFSGISVIYVHNLKLKSIKYAGFYDIGGHK